MDQVQNFIKEIVNGTHVLADTTVNVVDASLFPDPASGQYNLTWWDATNYPDPSGSMGDPKREIVRVTARDTGANTLTVTRAQEGTLASDKNTAGATYLLALTPTKKTIDDILAEAGDVAGDTVASDAITTPADADLLAVIVGGVLKKLTWANLKATLLTWLRLGTTVIPMNAPEGFLINGKIVPSVASNNLTVALKTLADADPSATDPVYCRIGGVVRTITSALSFVANAGASHLNLGSAEMATKETDLFAKLVYNTNTSAVSMIGSRIPFGDLISEYTDSTTAEKGYLYTGTKPASTDVVVNIGRFAATLSAGAGYTWSVPTYTAINLIQRPIYETRWLSWQPTYTGSDSMTYASVTTIVAKYRIKNNEAIIVGSFTGTTGGTASIAIQGSLPFTNITNNASIGSYVRDTAIAIGHVRVSSGLVQGLKSDESNFGLGTTRTMRMTIVYDI